MPEDAQLEERKAELCTQILELQATAAGGQTNQELRMGNEVFRSRNEALCMGNEALCMSNDELASAYLLLETRYPVLDQTGNIYFSEK